MVCFPEARILETRQATTDDGQTPSFATGSDDESTRDEYLDNNDVEMVD